MRLTNQEVEAKIAEAIESNATTFSLDDRLLTHIPDSIGCLTNLVHLGLAGNCLTNLPDSIFKLTKLASLRLGSNGITNMICPSTGHIHVLRVPPEIDSAELAITWINWGIHPSEIAIAT
ncbi:hypothetical protein [Chamaesiphon polymorphus]|uniref:Leucine-rich repeat domain-containing protein n=1 Tax=Chamaesiphon polymorphus CCALA 037 TaxID=2107692 RepID=A0A2T1GM04_9CYAN|nr:hypothetical protein [Chamaesiphon polymorphus]PSB58921.1 hypothetical protein C7B77_02790 [Chamaesiphon polymorphus CCALA 037]